MAWNVYKNGTKLDMYIYVSEQEEFLDFDDPSALFWEKRGLVYGDWSAGEESDGTFTISKTLAASKNVMNNGSIYMHAYLVKSGKKPKPKTSGYNQQSTVYVRKQLNKFKKRKFSKTKNLLTGETEQSVEDQEKAKTMIEEVNTIVKRFLIHLGFV